MENAKKYVTYEEFGAKGDGVTDDMPAIVACHEYANTNKLEVVGRDDANYYIGGKALTAEIKTNVSWGSAAFTIDDRELESIQSHCFRVASDHEPFLPNISSLSRGQSHIDFPHEGKVYVQVYNDNKLIYIRKGLNQNKGTAMSDCFTVEADGKIRGNINWDYGEITRCQAIMEDSPIVIRGGIFTTIANQQPSFYHYHNRGISIRRSNVTVEGLTHYVTGEGDTGAPYRGFISANDTFCLTVKDCLLTPHKTYLTESTIPGKHVQMGSYDLSFRGVVGITLSNITQTIDITDKRYWGLMGTDFCKDFLMENCTVSRFDAHMGVTNCTIRNCTLGHMGVSLIGFGDFYMENSTVKSHRVIYLRNDYGSFFHGKLVLKNCTWVPIVNSNVSAAGVIIATNECDHDFGYVCGMPQKIIIDRLLIADEHLKETDFKYYVFPDYKGIPADETQADIEKITYITPKNVVLKGITSQSGAKIIPIAATELYPNLSQLKIE